MGIGLVPVGPYIDATCNQGVPAVGALDAEALAKMLADKILSLPPARIAEIEDFIDFVAQRANSDQVLVRAAAAASETAFATVWDNEEDEVYDAL
jgi:hypothetical protein